jgi:hypothetical protein
LDGQPRINFFFFFLGHHRASLLPLCWHFTPVWTTCCRLYTNSTVRVVFTLTTTTVSREKKKKKKMTTVVQQQQLLGKSSSPFGRLLRLEEEAAAFGAKK